MITRRNALQLLVLAGAANATFGCRRNQVPGVPTLRVQLPWVFDAEFLGYLVANSAEASAILGRSKTFYEEVGIQVELKSGGPDIIPEVTLLGNSADVAITSPDNTLTYIAKERAPLTIIGAQYFKSPLGVVSLHGSGILKPKDLVGKRLAVPTVNVPSVNAMLEANSIDKNSVLIRPYLYDPTILIDGNVDATLDFVTNVPFVIEKKTGKRPEHFLLYDEGFPLLMDTIVMRKETLEGEEHASTRLLVKKWLSASRRAWEAVREETKRALASKTEESLPKVTLEKHFPSTKRDVDMERAFNRAQLDYIFHPEDETRKVFELDAKDIDRTIRSMNNIGIKAAPFHFDTNFIKGI